MKSISQARWIALAANFVLGGLPEGYWERAFIRKMAASPRAGDLLLYAAYRGDLSTVQAFLSHGVRVDATDHFNWRTGLHGAAQIIRYLIAKGSNVNAVDRFGDSPLELAISNHQDAAAKLLRELGAQDIKGSDAQREKAIQDQVQETIDAQRSRLPAVLN